MSAKRYSGNVTVNVEYVDARSHYKCGVSVDGKRGKTIIVNPPRSLTRSVDSPDSFDDTARAAIAFAEDEGLDTSGADFGDHGVVIHRRQPKRIVKAPRGFTAG